MSEMKTIVYPDMIEAAFLADEIDLLTAWIILKAVDIHSNNGKGFFSRDNALNILVKKAKMAKSTAYRALADGDNFYWKIANNRVYVKGITKICDRLGIKILNKKGMVVPIEDLSGNKGDNRAYLMGVMIAGAESPQSYYNIAKRCGLCRRTVIGYVNRCNHIKTIPNYTILSQHSTRDELLDALKDLKERNPRDADRYQAMRDNGGLYIGYRLPNSFISTLDSCSSNSKRRINKKIGDGNPGVPTDFRGIPLDSRTFTLKNKRTPLKKSDSNYSYKATVREVIVGESNVRDEMRIWTNE